MSGFDKFAWLNAVRDDKQISPGVKYVLQNAALTYVKGGRGNELHARQTTIAEKLGVSVRQVKLAYVAGRAHGYLVLVAQRQRGREGQRDKYRLEVPEQSAGTELSVGADYAPTDTQSRGTDCTEYVHGLSKVGARVEAVTSENDVPKGYEEGFKEGYGAQRDPSKGVAAPRAKNTNAQALGDIFNRYDRSGHAKPPNTAPSRSSLLHPKHQERIEAARKNLDLAQQQASQAEETA